MRNLAALCFSIGLLTGCAGLEMTTLRPDQVTNARLATGTPLEGYVVYEPIVTVEVSIKDVCLAGKDDNGKCKAQTVTQCAASTPFLLPDYSRPYLIKSKSGLGKAGIDIAITDGWRLANIKDNSDNTAILGTFEKLLGLKSGVPDAGGTKCKAPGLYRVTLEEGKPALTPLRLY